MERYGHVLFLPVFLSLCCFSFSFAFGLAAVSHKLVQNQSSIMTDLSKSLPTSSTNKTWNTTTDPCHWSGVTCSRGFVTALSLSGFGLSTTNTSLVSRFFELLCLLDDLKSLDLSRNFLTTIPGSFSNCRGLSGLESLNVGYNDLSGPLPRLSSFGALESLNLSHNNFYGAVHLVLEGLTTRLKSLDLSINSFQGDIPTRLLD